MTRAASPDKPAAAVSVVRMVLHNPTPTPIVFDAAGHVIDGYGRVDAEPDDYTRPLLDAGLLIEVPEVPDKSRRRRGEDS